MDPAEETPSCLAVPEVFYETLRSVHGVLCEDNFSVSFQRYTGDSEPVLLYHQHNKADNTPDLSPNVPASRPVEFRRKIIEEVPAADPKNSDSLMERLLREEQRLTHHQVLVPVVEVHPLRVVYSIMTDDAFDSSTISSYNHNDDVSSHDENGFCLISRGAAAVDALMALQRVASPNKATQSIRLWAKTSYGGPKRTTAEGDGYEWIDLTSLPIGVDGPMPLKEFVERHSSTGELEILVETRRTVNSQWPRHSLELSTRLKVGDLVDAQDVAGKWYEAIVNELDENTVTVHYVGWASRWDARIRRWKESDNANEKNKGLEGVPMKVHPPAPLWSQTGRWRERIQIGDIVEIRDSSSIVQRPKWYTGVVRKVGRPNDKPRKIEGGADLEEYSINGEPKAPLMILGRKQQVLVEVEQEISEKASLPATVATDTDSCTTGTTGELKPRPPFLRWVNLYGEEICCIDTHLKQDAMAKPVTIRYETDGNRKPVEILKSSHPSLGSGFMRESLRGMPPAPGSVGLQNLGNSCFMNSTLQCLNHIEPLTQFFLQNKHNDELNRSNPLGSGGNVALAYASLLKKMWGGEYSVLAPRLLKQTVANFAPQFDNSYQHDSQEFCQFLLDGLHEDLNRVKTKPYVEDLEGFGQEDNKTSIEAWRKHLLRHDSVVVDHCQGMHRSHLTCPHCGRESIKFDIYSSISLPLVTFKDQSTINLEDCIEKFMEGEQLDERNAWYCPSCRKHVCALKMIALWSTPDILIFHLKRFTFDTCMTSGSMLRSKIDTKVEFPIERLDLTKHVLGTIDPSAPPIYKLFGVSEHTGLTANSGHYTATVRNSIDNQWYRCNDSHVGQTSGEASITGGAYVLFYQRANGISKWGGMHKVMVDRGINPYGGLETDQEGFTKVKAKKKTKK